MTKEKNSIVQNSSMTKKLTFHLCTQNGWKLKNISWQVPTYTYTI